MQQSPRAAVVGCVFQVRVVKKVVFLVPHRCLAADHHKAVAAFHAAHLVRGHQLAPRDLIAVAGRAVAALADALPLGADGLLAQQLGNVLKGAVIVAAKVNKTVAVADDRFPVVLVFAFDLGNILQNDIAAYVAAARNGKDLYKVLRRGDIGKLVHHQAYMNRQCAVEFRRGIRKAKQLVKQLGVQNRNHKVKGIVIVGDDAEDGAFLHAQLRQEHFIGGNHLGKRRRLQHIEIRDVRAICTAPEGINLVAVKIETNEPELYGVGCATFAHRYSAVVTVINDYLRPFLIGKDPSNIEDIWQSVMGMSYWRNGPVLNNALSGVDMALWDIKGKMAGMPLYQLFGGKCRAAIPCYTHAEGDSVDVVLERVAALKELGYRKIRVQVGGYGGKNPSMHRPENSPPGAYFDPKSYIRNVLNLMEILHVKYGGELEFCHDTHERLSPIDAVNFAKELEPYHLLFLEDALPPEQSDWFRILRQQCATPLAMGELFNNPQEWKHLVQEHLIDYIRIHVSQIGGITPARKVIAFCDAYGVRTAWHGPIDMTPIGHAVNAHLDISCPNLGVQEWTDGLSGLYPTLNGRLMQEIFPGMPERRDGYLYLNDKPGIGVDINEELAARYPCKNTGVSWNWMLARLPDGTAVRP